MFVIGVTCLAVSFNPMQMDEEQSLSDESTMIVEEDAEEGELIFDSDDAVSQLEDEENEFETVE